jgi:uncharacterized coiled-coil protein SlyX
MDDDEFPRISTGNGFQNDLIATTNDRIKKQVLATRELHDSIKVLDTSIKDFNEESSSQTDKLISLTKSITKSNKEASGQTKTLITLTKWIVVLTIVLVIGLIIQIIALVK